MAKETLKEKILKALQALSPDNDEHWTQSGLPALKAVMTLSGEENVGRADVEDAAPGFNREKAREALLTTSPFPPGPEEKSEAGAATEAAAEMATKEGTGATEATEAPDERAAVFQEAQAADQEVADLEQQLEEARKRRAETHARTVEVSPQATLAQCNAQFRRSLHNSQKTG